MDSETSPRLTLEKPAIGGEREISLEKDEPSHPTDSMVTIRLSDPMIEPSVSVMNPELIIDDSAGDEISKTEGELDLLGEGESMTSLEQIGTQSCPGEVNKTSRDNGELTFSTSPIEEESTKSVPQHFRPRSDSSGTFSSVASAQVDWDELDKSEEQAPRDEGSDEVSTD